MEPEDMFFSLETIILTGKLGIIGFQLLKISSISTPTRQGWMKYFQSYHLIKKVPK